VDPAAQNGTVTVDVSLEGPLPRGARPDLTVDGTIDIDRLTDVLHVGRPAQGPGEGQSTLFRLEPDGVHASRVPVRLGRASVTLIEVLDGLAPGTRSSSPTPARGRRRTASASSRATPSGRGRRPWPIT
jgi:multidrug efflux pump subunit AcrA (membrane-fusion protein)